MLTVTSPDFKELTEDEKNSVATNGAGKEYANYLRVEHDDKTILLKNDAMEPEDVSFSRDLSWVGDIIEKAYALGKADAVRS